MPKPSFSRQVSTLTTKYERRMLYVARESTQRVITLAQKPVAKGGHMPVDTGFLRNSLETSLYGGTAIVGPDQYGVALNQLTLGQTVRFRWTASYALYVHYGTRNMQGRFWITLAAQQWRGIVDQVVAQSRRAIP